VALLEGIRVAIYRSLIRVLAGHHCVVALGKLLTPMCLCVIKQYNLVPVNGGDLFGWRSNRGPGKKRQPTIRFMVKSPVG